MLLPFLNVVVLIRAFYILSSLAGVTLGAVPFLRHRYMDYGLRSQQKRNRSADSPKTGPTAWMSRTLDPVLALNVPHRWFIHYYLVSVGSGCFWGYQLYSRGHVVQLLSRFRHHDGTLATMSANQVWLCWGLMLLQGSRRLLESYLYMKSSIATMPISIYLIGIFFYLVTNVAVWIEGIVLKSETADVTATDDCFYIFPIYVFTIASAVQFACHRHLFTLQKYSLPTSVLFYKLICPHYLMECIIYLALARIGAPAHTALNHTLLCVTFFVVINLGVVAESTRKWWSNKFGASAVEKRWRMIPLIW